MGEIMIQITKSGESSMHYPDVALERARDQHPEAVAGEVQLDEDDKAFEGGGVHVRDGAVAQVDLFSEWKSQSGLE